MDPIANMLSQIKNAGMAGREFVAVPYSRLKHSVAELLMREGYVASVEAKGEGIKKHLYIGVAFEENKAPRVSSVKRVSRPSRRIYMGVQDIKPVRQGYGVLVLSTPKGLLTDKEARKEHVGGEALFEIY